MKMESDDCSQTTDGATPTGLIRLELRGLILRIRRDSNNQLDIYQARDFASRMLFSELCEIANDLAREEDARKK